MGRIGLKLLVQKTEKSRHFPKIQQYQLIILGDTFLCSLPQFGDFLLYHGIPLPKFGAIAKIMRTFLMAMIGDQN